VRFLFVCAGKVVRSPAAQAVMREIGGGMRATRSAGIAPFCLRPVSAEDLQWADVVAVMEPDHQRFIALRWPEVAPKVRVLHVEARYHRHDPALAIVLEARLWDLPQELRVV
jgi:predicted protein tyrosine phosphatase